MKSNELLYSEGKNDEQYTPRYGVEPLVKYIKEYIKIKGNIIIWCPFDTIDSEFVKVFKENGFNVVYSHINEGKNFFNYEPEKWDIIISNPPFTDKRKYFERVLSFGKPFALLMTLTWLNDSGPKLLFKEKDLQLLMFNKRIRYNNPYGLLNNNPTFSSGYYCFNFLPKQIIMELL